MKILLTIFILIKNCITFFVFICYQFWQLTDMAPYHNQERLNDKTCGTENHVIKQSISS